MKFRKLIKTTQKDREKIENFSRSINWEFLLVTYQFDENFVKELQWNLCKFSWENVLKHQIKFFSNDTILELSKYFKNDMDGIEYLEHSFFQSKLGVGILVL